MKEDKITVEERGLWEACVDWIGLEGWKIAGGGRGSLRRVVGY